MEMDGDGGEEDLNEDDMTGPVPTADSDEL